MRSFTVLALSAAGLSLIASAVVQRAKADAWDKMTYVTIHEKIIAGNQVLEPGTYVWKLMDSQSDRHVVQIFNQDQSHIYQTILAIPNYRLQPTGDSRFAFWETPPGVPKAVRAWFYPGDNFGQEFAYPKSAAVQIAAVSHQPVPTTEAIQPAELPKAEITQTQPEPQEVAQATPPPAPATQEPALAPAPAAAAVPAPQELPKTASPYPLIGLAGLLSLGLFALLRSFRLS